MCVVPRPAAALKPITVTGEQDRDRDHQRSAKPTRAAAIAADRDGAGVGRRDGPHERARRDARHQPELAGLRAAQSDRQDDRALADRRPLHAVGSGIVWPDLDARRIEAVAFGRLPCRSASRAIAPTSSA